MKNIVKILAVITLIALTACAAAETAAFTLRNATVYEETKASAKAIGSVKKGANVKVGMVKNGWAVIEHDGNFGYVRVKDLCSKKPLKTLTVTSDTLVTYITRDGAKRNALLTAGTTVYQRGCDGTRLLISDKANTRLAYIDASNVK